MWFGTHEGLSPYDGTRFINFTTEDGLAHNWVTKIHCDPDGVMWFGTWGGGVSRYDGKQFVNFTRSLATSATDGLAHNWVTAIHCDQDRIMWFGTDGGGVSRYDGNRFTNFPRSLATSATDGMARNSVSFIYQAADGLIWFATRGSGVLAYDGVAWTSLDTRDGLAGNVFGRAICQDSEGVLWFGTDGGITRYRRSTVKPTVRILSVQAEQLYTADDHTGKFLQEIPPITAGTLVTISYNAIDTKTIPEKRQYRCRILKSTEGFLPSEGELSRKSKGVRGEEESKELESRDTTTPYNSPTKEVRFQWVPQKAGTYTFEVQAIDRALNYSEPAAVHLTVLPDPRDIALAALQTEVNHLRREVGRKYNFENIIGRSAAVKQVTALMEKAIDSGLTVLITGETGTGKELVAKAIHYNSPRKAHSIQELNCGAVPKDLVASTLFGHRKGAFTGANQERVGLFESADGGTVLLDEIAEMPNDAQVHLLRVLQERKIQRLGEFQLRDVDVRVIAITNRDLEQEVGTGRFRTDLYHRLNVFPIHVPALRERADDILLLAEHILQKACHQSKSVCEKYQFFLLSTFMMVSGNKIWGDWGFGVLGGAVGVCRRQTPTDGFSP